jgi:hypothetical protein
VRNFHESYHNRYILIDRYPQALGSKMEVTSLAGLVLDLVLIEGGGVGYLDFRLLRREVLQVLLLPMRKIVIEGEEGC